MVPFAKSNARPKHSKFTQNARWLSSDACILLVMAKERKDFSQTAFDIVARSTGTPTTDDFTKIERATKGGEARSEILSPERRSEIAKAAAAKRWGNSDRKNEMRAE